MNTRIYAKFPPDIYEAILKIDALECRHSLSNTVASLCERQIRQMREEWRQTGNVKLSKSRKDQDKQDVEKMLLNPE